MKIACSRCETEIRKTERKQLVPSPEGLLCYECLRNEQKKRPSGRLPRPGVGHE